MRYTPIDPAHDVFNWADDMQLRPSATLFASVSAPESVFEQVLARFFGGAPDPETVQRLGG